MVWWRTRFPGCVELDGGDKKGEGILVLKPGQWCQQKGKIRYHNKDIQYQDAKYLQVVVPGSVVERRHLATNKMLTLFYVFTLFSVTERRILVFLLVLFDGLDRPYFRQDGSTFLCFGVRPIQGEAEKQELPLPSHKFAIVISVTDFPTKNRISLPPVTEVCHSNFYHCI